MVTILLIHFYSILAVLVWMVLEALIANGNIDIIRSMAEEASRGQVPVGALWATVFILPELVLFVSIAKLCIALVSAIFP